MNLKSIVTRTIANCEMNDGLVVAFAVGGTAPYTYVWTRDSDTTIAVVKATFLFWVKIDGFVKRFEVGKCLKLVHAIHFIKI